MKIKQKLLSFLIFFLVASTIISSGCINEKNNNSKVEEKIDLKYTATINPNNNSNYILYIPLIVHGNWVEMNNEHELDGNPLDINQEFEIIEGSGNVIIINTEHGNAFKINASDPIKLIIYHNNVNEINTYGSNPNIRLSLINDSDNDGRKDDEYYNAKYWIYLNSFTNNNVDIDISLKIL